MYGNKFVVKIHTYLKKEIILPSFRSFVQRFSMFTTMFVVQRQMVFQKFISGGDDGREFYFSLGRRLSIFLFHR